MASMVPFRAVNIAVILPKITASSVADASAVAAAARLCACVASAGSDGPEARLRNLVTQLAEELHSLRRRLDG